MSVILFFRRRDQFNGIWRLAQSLKIFSQKVIYIFILLVTLENNKIQNVIIFMCYLCDEGWLSVPEWLGYRHGRKWRFWSQEVNQNRVKLHLWSDCDEVPTDVQLKSEWRMDRYRQIPMEADLTRPVKWVSPIFLQKPACYSVAPFWPGIVLKNRPLPPWRHWWCTSSDIRLLEEYVRIVENGGWLCKHGSLWRSEKSKPTAPAADIQRLVLRWGRRFRGGTAFKRIKSGVEGCYR